MNVQSLPPKMTTQFAERARNGDWQYHIPPSIFLWFQGNQEICVIGSDAHAVGHIKKYSTQEATNRKNELEPHKNKNGSA